MLDVGGRSGMGSLVGASVKSREHPRFLMGQGRFIDDIQPIDVLHAAFLRSPITHARISHLDVTAARAATGVIAVVTGADLAAITNPIDAISPLAGPRPLQFYAMAVDKVRFVGDPVAVVVARSRHLAEDALELIEVDYDPLPPVTSPEVGLAAGAAPVFDELGDNILHHSEHVVGDVDAALARSARVVRATFTGNRHGSAPMETRGGVAVYDPGIDELVYHATTQIPHLMRTLVAGMINHPVSSFHVVAPDIGGSFGQKWVMAREDIAVCATAKLLSASVKWIEDRAENLVGSGHARDDRLSVEAGVMADGTITALRVRHVQDHGAYPALPLLGYLIPEAVRVVMPVGHHIDNYSYEITSVATNKGAYVPYRGPQAPETWVRERLLDVIGRELGIEPVEVRRKNLVQPNELPTKSVTGASLDVSLVPVFERALELVDLPSFRIQQHLDRETGRLTGIGVANILEPAPGPPDWADSIAPSLGTAVEPALVRLESDGRLTVFTGQAPQGQSHSTTLAQVAAAELGVPIESVRVVHGDTRTTPFSMIGTGGSRAASLAGRAVLGATRQVRAKVLRIVSQLLEVSEDDLEIVESVVRVRGTPEAALPLAQIGMLAYLAPDQLPPGLDHDLSARHEVPPGAGGWWTPATHVCFVEVDAQTGLIRVPRYVVVEDCGTMINPAVVDGQIRGGVAQGLGGVLFESAAFDSDGQPQASTFMDYLLPTAVDVPDVEIHHLGDHGPDNFRGVGEGGAMVAPAALLNAVEDALAHLGVRITEQYLPPSRVLELMGVLR